MTVVAAFQAPHVDYVAPMVYPSHWNRGEYGIADPNRDPYGIVKASLADFKASVASTGRPLVPWLQDFDDGVHYGDAEHWVCGDHAVSKWLLTGTTTLGEQISVRGCDLFDLSPDGKIRRKDSYWKITS